MTARQQFLLRASALTLGLVAATSPAFAAKPICDAASIGFSANPVTEGTPVDITGEVKQTAPNLASCTNGTAGNYVSGGTLGLEIHLVGSIPVPCAFTGSGCSEGANLGQSCTDNTDCDTAPLSGDGVCTAVAFTSLASETSSDGYLQTTFDTTNLGGYTAGVRNHYVPSGGSGYGEDQMCADLEIDAGAECTPGATIAATLASGNGLPWPDNNKSTNDGPWTFRITVTACGALTGVTAQGGDNGWAPTARNGSGMTTDTGTVDFRKQNRKNNVILWTIGDMSDGQVANLDVVVNGNIPYSTPDCQWRNLCGGWSAKYSLDGGLSFEQTAHTPEVLIEVDTGHDGTCYP